MTNILAFPAQPTTNAPPQADGFYAKEILHDTLDMIDRHNRAERRAFTNQVMRDQRALAYLASKEAKRHDMAARGLLDAAAISLVGLTASALYVAASYFGVL